MEENFEPVARTRANYYTPGSPVQFVCVELLKGEISGEHAVCLTFKNISKVTLTALEIHFKCKGVDGIILCEDEFEYRDIAVKPGENFGMDDAVFVTQKAITSVDVSLKNVYNGKRVVHLDAIKRVRLPAPRRLSPELQKALEARMNRQGLKYMPQVFENGWYCACGAFHPKEEDTVYCSECGSDRILLQNALNTLLQPEAPVRQPEPQPAAQPESQESQGSQESQASPESETSLHAAKRTKSLQRTLGIGLLLLSAFQMTLLLVLRFQADEILILLLPLLLCGIICLVCKKHTFLWIGWVISLFLALSPYYFFWVHVNYFSWIAVFIWAFVTVGYIIWKSTAEKRRRERY